MYKPSPMKPAPWCFNGHAHTILPSLLFDSPILNRKKVIIDTPDNDNIEADLIDNGDESPIVVLLHGLEGSSRRYYITNLAQHFSNRAFSVLAVNFRGCGEQLNKQRRFYHSGETEDLNTVLAWIQDNLPNRKIFAAGFSLGASILLNFLKKEKQHHPLLATAAISTPFDLKKGSLNLNKGFNKIYSIRFLRTLKEKLNDKKKVYPDLPDFTGSTLFDFDDQVTGPIHGFSGAEEYYHNCSSGFFINQIQTDTLVIHSKDDPLCPFVWTPVTDISHNSKTIGVFPKNGGHVGFWSLPPGWLNRTVGDYFEQFL